MCYRSAVRQCAAELFSLPRSYTWPDSVSTCDTFVERHHPSVCWQQLNADWSRGEVCPSYRTLLEVRPLGSLSSPWFPEAIRLCLTLTLKGKTLKQFLTFSSFNLN
ncbi:hypothetical protein CHARACLAT_027755 [Characodon lateralis]|uniref:Uncharacterized protein n=1 Tax=Characodon lateralis TaxID=208331 RepID=A0ABU7DPA1_9TELE|nr:hypothetical protein [Characodon lateralis]